MRVAVIEFHLLRRGMINRVRGWFWVVETAACAGIIISRLRLGLMRRDTRAAPPNLLFIARCVCAANYVERCRSLCVYGCGVNQVPYIPSARCTFFVWKRRCAALCSLIRLKLLLNCYSMFAPITRTKEPVLYNQRHCKSIRHTLITLNWLLVRALGVNYARTFYCY